MDVDVRRGLAQEQRSRTAVFVRLEKVSRIESIQAIAQDRGGKKEFLRVQQRPFYVMPSLLPALLCASCLVLSRFVYAILQHQLRRSWQVIENAGSFSEKQRQILLKSLWVNSGTQILVETHAPCINIEAIAEGAPEQVQRGLVGRVLARGQHLDLADLSGGALRFRVEFSNAVNFLVKQIQAERNRAAGRKQVQHRATDRILS